MSRYGRLRDRLLAFDGPELELSLGQIEELLGFRLPARASMRSWWKFRRRSPPAWQRASFHAELLPHGKGVRFRRVPAGGAQVDGYGKYRYDPEGFLRRRYTALDPSAWASRCTCQRPNCTRNHLRPFRDHIAELFRVLSAIAWDAQALDNSAGWESVRYSLRLAASISDVDADTGYVEDPQVYGLCEPTIDYDDADSQMASQYVAGAAVFNFLWLAYEAAVEATASDELRGLLKDGRLGERGRRLFEARPDLHLLFPGVSDLTKLAIYHCRAGERMEARLEKLTTRFPDRDLVLAAELCREFRNFLFHGEDEVPAHPDWGSGEISHARLRRFYSIGRLLLYLIQAMAWISCDPDAEFERDGDDEEDERRPPSLKVRERLTRLQFRDPRLR